MFNMFYSKKSNVRLDPSELAALCLLEHLMVVKKYGDVSRALKK